MLICRGEGTSTRGFEVGFSQDSSMDMGSNCSGETVGTKLRIFSGREFVLSHPHQRIFGKSSQGTFIQLKEARNPQTFWKLTQPLTDCELFCTTNILAWKKATLNLN